MPKLNVSYKPQKISPKFPGTVRELMHKKIREAYTHPQFISDVMKPLNIEAIIDNTGTAHTQRQGAMMVQGDGEGVGWWFLTHYCPFCVVHTVQDLSGGELQRVAITLCLGTPADVYLVDEPSAYLDSEQRIACSKVIKRFIMHSKKTAFVVEHDFIMATYLADRSVLSFPSKHNNRSVLVLSLASLTLSLHKNRMDKCLSLVSSKNRIGLVLVLPLASLTLAFLSLLLVPSE